MRHVAPNSLAWHALFIKDSARTRVIADNGTLIISSKTRATTDTARNKPIAVENLQPRGLSASVLRKRVQCLA